MKPVIFGCCLVLLACVGCATTARDNRVAFKVRSDPPGCPVEVNGINMGTTPTTIQLGVSKRWVGFAYSSDGWDYGQEAYQVTCFPPPDWHEALVSQTKLIQPGMAPETAELYFNLRLRPYVPPQQIQIDRQGKEEITVKTDVPQDEASRLRKLKHLLNEGLISEDEYESKRQDILNGM